MAFRPAPRFRAATSAVVVRDYVTFAEMDWMMHMVRQCGGGSAQVSGGHSCAKTMVAGDGTADFRADF
jgi:hypothetical protein